MGNSPSAQRQPQDGSPRPDNFELCTESHLSNQDAMVVTSYCGTRRSRQEARQQLREELFGAGEQSNGNNDMHESTNTASQEVKLQPSEEVLTTNPTNAPITMDTALLILRELKKTASPDDILALQMALLPNRSQAPLKSPQGTVKPSTNGTEPTAAAVIRRRSLFTPGIATRTGNRNVLRKVSSTSNRDAALRVKTWSPEMFVASPLERLASIDLHVREGGIDDPLSTRSETPVAFDRTQLGFHQLGSLRITNGAASPEPSVFSAAPTPISPGKDDDYYTASEGTGRNSPEDLETYGSIRSEDYDGDPSLYSMSRYSTPAPSSISHSHSLHEEGSPYSQKKMNGPPMPQLMYLAEVKSNPFVSAVQSQKKEPGTGLDGISTSSYTIVLGERDSGSDIGQSDPWHIAPSPSSPRQDSRQTLTQSYKSPYVNPTAAPSASSGILPDMRSEADSGYTSDSSICTIKSPILETRLDATNGQRLDGTSMSDPKQSDGLLLETDFDQSNGLELTSPTETVLGIPSRNRISDISVPEPSHSSLQTTPERLSLPGNTDIRGTVKPLDFFSGPAAEATPKRSNAKKLQKSRPKLGQNKSENLVVQSQYQIESTPSIPAEIRSKHADRMGKTPGMDHLEHTYRSVTHSNSQPYTESEADVSVYDMHLRFPSPAPTEEQEERSRSRKKNWRTEAASTSPSRRFRARGRSESRKRKKNSENSSGHDAEEFTGVTDFGDILLSLGASPYEISSRHVESPKGLTKHAIHPHQLTTRVRGSKSTGMSGKDASDLAFERSSDRRSKLLESQQNSSPAHLPNSSMSPQMQGNANSPYMQSVTDGQGGSGLGFLQASHSTPISIQPDAEHIAGGHLPGKTERLDDKDGWGIHAQAWRLRRKSIGENLLRQSQLHNQDSKPQEFLERRVSIGPTSRRPRFYAETTTGAGESGHRSFPYEMQSMHSPNARFSDQLTRRPAESGMPSQATERMTGYNNHHESQRAYVSTVPDREPTLPNIEPTQRSQPLRQAPLTIKERAAMFERPVYSSYNSAPAVAHSSRW